MTIKEKLFLFKNNYVKIYFSCQSKISPFIEITTTKQFLGHLPSPECSINLTEVDDNYLDATATLIRPQIFAYNQCNVIQSDALGKLMV